MRILELFAGIGACSKALERLGIDVEIVDAVEIDKYAIASFNAIHRTDFKVQDIKEWDKNLKDIDLITHGSPCQDFSVAGKQAGGDLGSGTRSSLMYETIRIVGKLRPKYVLWENVKNILSKKHKHNFEAYIETMNILGFNSYYKVLDAKDYGVPQHRERVYTVSIRKDIDKGYVFPKKEILNNKINKIIDLEKTYEQSGRIYDSNGLSPTIMSNSHNGGYIAPKILIGFKFPEKEELKLRLKDILEDEVDEKYYLSQKMIDGFIKHNENHKQKRTGFLWNPKTKEDIANTLSANAALCPTDNTIKVGETTPKSQAGQVYSTEGISPTIIAGTHGYAIGNILQVGNLEIKGQDNIKRVYSPNGISPTLTNMQGGNRQPKILVKNATKKGYDEAIEVDSINLAYPNSKTRKGRVGHQISQTLTANDNMAVLEVPFIATSRGRNPNNPNSKEAGQHLEQRLEPNINGTSNCISTVQKDNYVVEKNIKIRKLTPLECWRLMGFDDEDFKKAARVPTSNTQLYKQARKQYRG